MPPRGSKKHWKEFQEYIKQYEGIHGIQDTVGLRLLAKEFARTKAQFDEKASQPLYYSLFTSICYERHRGPDDIDPLPADFNFDNPYDPDGLYLDDKDIKRKLKRFDYRVAKDTVEVLNSRNIGLPNEHIVTIDEIRGMFP